MCSKVGDGQIAERRGHFAPSVGMSLPNAIEKTEVRSL